MKILFIHTAYRFKGGEESVVEAEINLLRRHGVEVELLTFSNPSNAVCAAWVFFVSVFNFASYLRTRRAIRRFRPDVVHVHNWHFKASAAVFWAARAEKVPVVHTLHNYRLVCPSGILFFNGELFLDSLNQRFPWSAVRKKVYRNSRLQTFWLGFVVWLHDRIGTWSNVNRFIVLTEFSRENMLASKRNWRAAQFVIKPNFVENIEVAGEKRDSGAFLYIGRHSVEKGIRVLTEAAADSAWRLDVIGNGPLKQEVIALSEAYPERISYPGYVDEATKYRYLRDCSALILPSVCFEGMPVTIVEAFSFGVPIIASDRGAMQSMIEDGYTGLLFEPGNAQALNACVERWKAYPEDEKERIRGNARKTFEALYTAEKNYLQMMEIYSAL